MMLSPHFSLAELTTTSTGLDNSPTGDSLERLRTLCVHVLEPWRLAAGRHPMKVTSGYRSGAVNQAVNGSRTSQHRKGEAADIVPVDRAAAWDALLLLIDTGLPVDQAIIYEGTNHVHVSHTARYEPRRQVLVKLQQPLPDGRNYVLWVDYAGPLKAAS